MYLVYYLACDSFDDHYSIIEFDTRQEREDFFNDPLNQSWIDEWHDYYVTD